MNPISKHLTAYHNKTMPVWHGQINNYSAVFHNKVWMWTGLKMKEKMS